MTLTGSWLGVERNLGCPRLGTAVIRLRRTALAFDEGDSGVTFVGELGACLTGDVGSGVCKELNGSCDGGVGFGGSPGASTLFCCGLGCVCCAEVISFFPAA